MSARNHFTRRSAVLAAVALLAVTAACGRDALHPHDEPDVHAVRLSFNNGAQTVTVTEGQRNASVNLPAGSSATVSAQFLDASNAVITDIHGDEFELRVLGRTFTRSGPFAGTVSGLTSGTNPVTIQLWHFTVNHDDFEVPLNIVVP